MCGLYPVLNYANINNLSQKNIHFAEKIKPDIDCSFQFLCRANRAMPVLSQSVHCHLGAVPCSGELLCARVCFAIRNLLLICIIPKKGLSSHCCI